MNLEGDEKAGTSPLTAEEFSQGLDESILSLEDHWILSSLNRTVKEVNSHLANYLFDQAALEAYDFFWKEFCSYYVEIAKPSLFGKTGSPEERKNKQKLLAIILCQAMRLIHPMAPFISEELFQQLKKRLQGVQIRDEADPYTAEAIQALLTESCIVAPYPEVIREQDLNPDIERTFNLVGQIVYTIRNIRGEVKLQPSVATDIHIVGSEEDQNFKIVKNHLNIIAALVRVSSIETHTKEPKIDFAGTGVLNSLKIMVPLPKEMLKQEKSRLTKEKDKLNASRTRIRDQLANQEFVKNAPEHLIEKQRQALQQTENELSQIVAKLDKMHDV